MPPRRAGGSSATTRSSSRRSASGHYEGRGWRGFHHHASLSIAAYGFLVAERCLFPPQARFTARRLKAPALPKGFQPRGAGPA